LADLEVQDTFSGSLSFESPSGHRHRVERRDGGGTQGLAEQCVPLTALVIGRVIEGDHGGTVIAGGW
jgi:hypothetical protein